MKGFTIKSTSVDGIYYLVNQLNTDLKSADMVVEKKIEGEII